jgi:P27 family predicted phage terminase small subunit
MKDRSKPPAHLKAATKRWWRSVVEEYALEPHHVRLLTLAAEAWDRCEQAREALSADGLTFRDDRGNIRPHPLIAMEKDSRTAFARLIRELDLDVEPGGPDYRPPPLRSNTGGR